MTKRRKAIRAFCNIVMAFNAICVLVGTFMLVTGSFLVGALAIVANVYAYRSVRKERDDFSSASQVTDAVRVRL